MGRKIVILANSRKLSGRCVAGKDADGNWIRLTKISHNPVPVSEARNYGMLKIVDVDGITNRPSREFKYHTENSTYTRASVTGNFDAALLDRLVDNPPDVFGVGGNYVDEDDAQELRNSLLLLKVSNLRIYLKDFGDYGIKLRGQFSYNGQIYTDISVTDSSVEQRLRNVAYPYSENYDEAYITISLGEIFRGAAYKLISGVIIP